MMNLKNAICLGIASIILSSSVIFPLTAQAGKDVIPGTTSDSSGTIGDTFDTTVITPNVTTRVEGVSISRDTRNGEVILTVTKTIQVALNKFAVSLFDDSNASPLRLEVRELFARRDKNVITVTDKIKRDWVSYGLQESRIDVFLTKLSECVTVVGTSSEFEEPLFVEVNKLSVAIDDYNLLIKESNSSTLVQLSQDETFREISSILKELRATLETTS